jgi:hypothetical protein
MIDGQTQCQFYVSIIPPLLINLHFNSKDLPYRICDDFTGLGSLLFYVNNDVGMSGSHQKSLLM